MVRRPLSASTSYVQLGAQIDTSGASARIDAYSRTDWLSEGAVKGSVGCAGPGSAGPQQMAGVRSAALDDVDAPECPPGPASATSGR